jgi:hypothetical protein
MSLNQAANSSSADVVERRLGRLAARPKADVEVQQTCNSASKKECGGKKAAKAEAA